MKQWKYSSLIIFLFMMILASGCGGSDDDDDDVNNDDDTGLTSTVISQIQGNTLNNNAPINVNGVNFNLGNNSGLIVNLPVAGP